MNSYFKPITKQCIAKILEQMNNYSIYEIIVKGDIKSKGFFCKIKYQNKNIPVIIINDYILYKNFNNIITLSLNNSLKTIKLGNAKYKNKENGITILEIKEKNEKDFYFFEIDDKLYENNFETQNENESIYTIQSNNKNDISISYGQVYQINNSEMRYSCYISSKANGLPIFNLKSNKIIGLHEMNYNFNKNKGLNLKSTIHDFIEKFKYNNKQNQENNINSYNELDILININREEINKEIYFLDNYKYKDTKSRIHFHDNLKELNDSNTEIYINNKKYKYKKYFVPEKEGRYNIKLKFNINLTDCSFMFAGCNNIIGINFISFETKYINNMKYMFYNCNFKNINLLLFNTINVLDMSHMFENCKKIKQLDLLSFGNNNIKNINKIFNGCYNLDSLITEDTQLFKEKYYNNLEIIIKYYTDYYPYSKRKEIEKYSKQLLNYKNSDIDDNNIEINILKGGEIGKFESYEKSKFFSIFYGNKIKIIGYQKFKENIEELEQEEINRFNKAEIFFNKLEYLFNGKDLELDFLEAALNKLENSNNDEILLKEINYLKEYFEYQKSDEKEITKNLIIYKNRRKISLALKSLNNLCKFISVKNMENIVLKIEILSKNIYKIKNYFEIPKYFNEIKTIDENFFEENFIETLINLNEDLINFLNSQNIEDIISQKFAQENNELLSNLQNALQVFQNIKRKASNFHEFIDNFRSIIYKNNNINNEIAYINNTMNILQNLIIIDKEEINFFENFLNKGKIIFRSIQKQQIELFNICFDTKIQNLNKNKFLYDILIIIDDKEYNLENIQDKLNNVEIKTANKHIINKEIYFKTKIIVLFITEILKELNNGFIDVFNEIYEIKNFQFLDDEGILRLPQLEKLLKELRKKNQKIYINKIQELNSNLNLLIKDDKKYINGFQYYFQDIQYIEKNYEIKLSEKINYKNKECKNFDFCNNYLEIYKHKFLSESEETEIDLSFEFEKLQKFIQYFFALNQIKKDFRYLKGIYLYKSEKEFFIINILKLFHLLHEIPLDNDISQNIPSFLNLFKIIFLKSNKL